MPTYRKIDSMKATRTKHWKATGTTRINRPASVAAMPELVTVPEVAAWIGVSNWSAPSPH